MNAGQTQGGVAFPEEEYRNRLSRIQQLMEDRGIDVLLLHSPEDICYVTGFETAGTYMYQAVIVPRTGIPHLIIRELEFSNVFQTSWVHEYTTYEDTEEPSDVTARAVRDLVADARTVGLDEGSWFLTARQARNIRNLLVPADIVDSTTLTHGLRSVKSDAEIEMIRRASRVVEASMTAAVDKCRSGATENDVAAAAYDAMIQAGGEYPSLPQFVSAGERTFLTHATWSGRRFGADDIVFLELSGVIRRYASALLRCVHIGSQVAPRTREIADVAQAGLDLAIAEIRPGVPAGEIARKVGAMFAEHGFVLRKRIGYSIGLNFPPDWGEWQVLCLRRDEERLLEPNMVFHVPSSVRIHNECAIAISETVRVTETGCESLTHHPRQLLIAED